MGFVRYGESSIPQVSSEKRYGNQGEDRFALYIRQLLPACRIKNNVIIETNEGNAEIDSLILYENKLFAIEVKSWKGKLYETENGFIQEKTDRWTGEAHIKYQKSPFKQLNRAVFLLKKKIPCAVWVNNIVFFENEEFESIKTLSDSIWFHNAVQLARYIMNDGKESIAVNAEQFFRKCVSADYLYAKSWDKSLHCMINDDSLRFQTGNGELNREQIRSIQITHHWSYDELNITLKDGNVYCTTQENATISVRERGSTCVYGMSKLDYIELGE